MCETCGYKTSNLNYMYSHGNSFNKVPYINKDGSLRRPHLFEKLRIELITSIMNKLDMLTEQVKYLTPSQCICATCLSCKSAPCVCGKKKYEK